MSDNNNVRYQNERSTAGMAITFKCSTHNTSTFTSTATSTSTSSIPTFTPIFSSASSSTTSRTIRTATAISHSSNTTVENATIVNSEQNKIIYQSRRQTVNVQQIAAITEITTQRTPTIDELNEMMDLLGSDDRRTADESYTTRAYRVYRSRKTVRSLQRVNLINQSGNKASFSGKQSPPHTISPTATQLERNSNAASYSTKRNSSSSSTNDSNSNSSSSNGGLKNPTLIRTEETIVTEQNNCSYTEQKHGNSSNCTKRQNQMNSHLPTVHIQAKPTSKIPELY